jgi:uncharacterized membrane protein
MELLQALLRWIHVVVGIIWIGHLYFFNWVNGPFQATMDGPTKKTVNPQLMPRALFWFRWGAAWTWITGVLLLLLVFYHGGLMFEGSRGWGIASFVMIAVTFLAFVVYEAVFKSGLGKDLKTGAGVCFAILVAIVLAEAYWAGWSYRAYAIHTGVLFGTIMAANVWMRIWPAQQKIITATRDGQPPDPALVAMAGARSRHNTYMSVPLVWAMINSHTTVLSSPVWVLVMVLVGWAAVYQIYTEAGKVKGF